MNINFRFILSLLAIVTFGLVGFAQETASAEEEECKKEIVGYYPNWQQYKRGGMFHQSNLDFSKYTIIEYAFMGLDEGGNVYLVDPWGDGKILDGEIDWSLTTDENDPQYVPYSNMVGLAHRAGTKVMVSIGGWTLSTNFPGVAADPKKRQRFAQSCVETCRKYDFDGVDIDWEFPGAAPGNGCEGGPEDKENFNLMIDVLRDSLDAYGEEIGQHMELTAAFHSVPYLAQQIDWEHVSEVLDYVNLFGYDFYGAWYPQANHNAPLYPPAVGDFGVNQSDGFLLLTEVYGVPAEKIILGTGFYGRSMKDLEEKKLFANHPGLPDVDNFPLHEGSPAYYEIIEKYPEYDVLWDDDAAVPYMLGKKSNSFVGYDDMISLQYKAAFICQQNAAGCLIWEVSQDLVEKPIGSGKVGGSPLIDVLNEVFEQYCQTGSYEVYGNKIDLRDTEELKKSYFERDAKVEKRQGGYTQDSVDELEKGLGSSDSTSTDATPSATPTQSVETEKLAPAQEALVLQDNVGDLNSSSVTSGGDEGQLASGGSVTVDEDAFDLDNVKKNELRNGEHLFEPGSLDILFDKNSSELSIGAKQNIKASAKFVVETGIVIELTGFASSVGNAEYNLKLSKQRAEAVKAYMIKMINYYASANNISIDASSKVKVKNAGETSNFGNEANNRRVTISYDASK